MSQYSDFSAEEDSSTRRARSDNGADTATSAAAAALNCHDGYPSPSGPEDHMGARPMYPEDLHLSIPSSFDVAPKDSEYGVGDLDDEHERDYSTVNVESVYSYEPRRPDLSITTVSPGGRSMLDAPRKRRTLSSEAHATKSSPVTHAPLHAHQSIDATRTTDGTPNKDNTVAYESLGDEIHLHDLENNDILVHDDHLGSSRYDSGEAQELKLIELMQRSNTESMLSLKHREECVRLQAQNIKVAEWLSQPGEDDSNNGQNLADQNSTTADLVTSTVPGEYTAINPVSDTASIRENRLQDGQTYFDFNVDYISEAEDDSGDAEEVVFPEFSATGTLLLNGFRGLGDESGTGWVPLRIEEATEERTNAMER
ncbi:hypothetical protein PVAG01_11092 [Phlyctema vagabunda]|uniref:Uncharacterized protein n=1 Tax=Phlyctema vagabunda TaxID=108571 RepID=A0ABR4P1A6_9HELO